MSDAVLDASAALALVKNEPGKDIVEAIAHQSVISSVNLAEVVSRLSEWGTPEDDIHTIVSGLSSETVPFDEGLAVATGLLRASTRHLGLSLGDRACLALAQRMGIPALTADRRWADLDLDVEIRQIRE